MPDSTILRDVIVALLGALTGLVAAVAYMLRRTASSRGRTGEDGEDGARGARGPRGLAGIAGVAGIVDSAEQFHDRVLAVIRSDRETLQWQQAIRREVRHEIANAVMTTVERLRRIDPPGTLDAYRDQALAAIADAFETWRKTP